MEVDDAARHCPSDESAQGVGCSRDAEGASMPEGFMHRFRRKKEQDNRPQVSQQRSQPFRRPVCAACPRAVRVEGRCVGNCSDTAHW